MTKGSKVVRFSRDQVSAARALILLRGGVAHVDPLIAKIAAATKPTRSADSAARAS